MSKLEELIEQYCPDGVEYYKIKDVYKRIKGTPITAGKMKEIATPDGSVRIFAGGKTVIDANEKDIPNANITRVPAVLIQSRGVIDAVYYDKPFTFKNEMWAYTTFNQKSVKYLYYILKSNIQTFRDAASGMGALPQISLGVTEEFEIPVPPLPVQEEIVRILDNFTELQAELQAELQKRKQQYNYYLDNLLNFNNINRGGYQAEVRWMKLKDVCMKTSNIKWKSTTGQYRYIDLSSVDIQTHSIISTIEIDKMSAPSRAQQIVQEDDVIFATTRPTQMRACIIPTQYNGDICSTGYCVLRVDTKILLPRFLFFSLTVSGFKTYLSNNLTLGNYPSISNNTLLEYEVPVPSLANQQRIVAILDRFDTLTTDLTQGLPAEIEKRRQQYEFYRDKLLTFKRKEA